MNKNRCDYLSTPKYQLIYISKRGLREETMVRINRIIQYHEQNLGK